MHSLLSLILLACSTGEAPPTKNPELVAQPQAIYAPQVSLERLTLREIVEYREAITRRLVMRADAAETAGSTAVAEQIRADVQLFIDRFSSVAYSDAGVAIEEVTCPTEPCLGFTVESGAGKAAGGNTAAGGWDANIMLMSLDQRTSPEAGAEIVLAHELRHVRQTLDGMRFRNYSMLSDETEMIEENQAYEWQRAVLNASTAGAYDAYIARVTDGVLDGTIVTATGHNIVYPEFPDRDQLFAFYSFDPRTSVPGFSMDQAIVLALFDLNRELITRRGGSTKEGGTVLARFRLSRNEPAVIRLILPQIGLPVPDHLK